MARKNRNVGFESAVQLKEELLTNAGRVIQIGSMREQWIMGVDLLALTHAGRGAVRRGIPADHHQNFIAHYHTERNHQGLGNRLISLHPDHRASAGVVRRHQRHSGMLNYYGNSPHLILEGDIGFLILLIA